MSDGLWGVIIGGLIGIIPSLVIVFVEAHKERKRQSFEIYLEHIRIYEASRKNALEDFAAHLGAMASSSLSSEFVPDRYFASAKMASIYVSDDTAAKINEVNNAIADKWNLHSSRRSGSASSLLSETEYTNLDRLIRAELYSSTEYRDKCPHRTNAKRKLNNR